jgi:hypothetical protein
MVLGDVLQRVGLERDRCGSGARPPARHDDEVVGAQGRPLTSHTEGWPLMAGDPVEVRAGPDIAGLVCRAEILGGGEDLGRTGEVEQVDAGSDDEEDHAHGAFRSVLIGQVTMPEPRRW